MLVLTTLETLSASLLWDQELGVIDLVPGSATLYLLIKIMHLPMWSGRHLMVSPFPLVPLLLLITVLSLVDSEVKLPVLFSSVALTTSLLMETTAVC